MTGDKTADVGRAKVGARGELVEDDDHMEMFFTLGSDELQVCRNSIAQTSIMAARARLSVERDEQAAEDAAQERIQHRKNCVWANHMQTELSNVGRRVHIIF